MVLFGTITYSKGFARSLAGGEREREREDAENGTDHPPTCKP
jgi:hypothetical protein